MDDYLNDNKDQQSEIFKKCESVCENVSQKVFDLICDLNTDEKVLVLDLVLSRVNFRALRTIGDESRIFITIGK